MIDVLICIITRSFILWLLCFQLLSSVPPTFCEIYTSNSALHLQRANFQMDTYMRKQFERVRRAVKNLQKLNKTLFRDLLLPDVFFARVQSFAHFSLGYLGLANFVHMLMNLWILEYLNARSERDVPVSRRYPSASYPLFFPSFILIRPIFFSGPSCTLSRGFFPFFYNFFTFVLILTSSDSPRLL